MYLQLKKDPSNIQRALEYITYKKTSLKKLKINITRGKLMKTEMILRNYGKV